MKKEILLTYCYTDFEDIILYAAFKNISNGYYVDIGANSPVSQSVTKYLYDNKGWHGINIEPLQEEYELLCKDRQKDINLNLGISDKRDKLILYVNGGGSTCVESIFKRKFEEYTKTEMIDVYTLTEILDKYLEKEQDIYFCKIDVEGFEKNVLNGLDFNKYRPFLFCMESTYPNTEEPSYHLWEDILIKNNYSLVFYYGVNRYYADVNCKMYNIIKHNLNADDFLKKNCFDNRKNIKSIFLNKLKSIWHLLPAWIRARAFADFRKNLTLKSRAKKLVSSLKLDCDIKIVIE